jgi:hypothetical protein
MILLTAHMCIYRVIEKSRNPFLTHVVFVKKYITLKAENKKTMLYLVLETSTAVSDACIHSFTHVWCNPVKSSCVMETVHQTGYCRFVWHRRIGKCIPKLILAS